MAENLPSSTLILGTIILIVNSVANFLAGPLSTVHLIANSLTASIISAFAIPIYPSAITYIYYAMVARENPTPPPLSNPEAHKKQTNQQP